MPPLLTITYHFFLQIAFILLTYRLLWPLFRRLGQVQVVAIMVAGFVLGPSVLGWIWPAGQRHRMADGQLRRVLHRQGRALARWPVRRLRGGYYGISNVGVDRLRLRI